MQSRGLHNLTPWKGPFYVVATLPTIKNQEQQNASYTYRPITGSVEQSYIGYKPTERYEGSLCTGSPQGRDPVPPS